MSDLNKLVTAVLVALDHLDDETGPRPVHCRFDELDEWNKLHRAAVENIKVDLEERGAKFSNPSGGYAVRFGGVYATSTSSIEGALRNWVTAAHKRLGKAA